MQTYKATVKVRDKFGCQVLVQTRVVAPSAHHAHVLLLAQYGQGSVVIFPTLCD